MALTLILQTDMNQIFQMRYCTFLQVKRLKKYQRSKLEVKKICQISRAPGTSVSNLAELAISYRPFFFIFGSVCSINFALQCAQQSYQATQICKEFWNVWHGQVKGLSKANQYTCTPTRFMSDPLLSQPQGRRQGGSMGAIAPIDFQKGLIGPINFHCKQG